MCEPSVFSAYERERERERGFSLESMIFPFVRYWQITGETDRLLLVMVLSYCFLGGGWGDGGGGGGRGKGICFVYCKFAKYCIV